MIKMYKILFVSIVVMICTFSIYGNTNVSVIDTFPYYEIPTEPETYNAATVTARFVDGLGFRYQWASSGLTAEDLAYEPGNEGMNCREVLDHILGLSRFILKTVKKEPHIRGTKYPELTWEETREATINNIKMASEILRETGDVSENNIVFKREDQTSELPFWNLLNGPISDAIYHTGQIVSFRRSSGNPIRSGLSMMRGNVRE